MKPYMLSKATARRIESREIGIRLVIFNSMSSKKSIKEATATKRRNDDSRVECNAESGNAAMI
jgi:hypothetical protein